MASEANDFMPPADVAAAAEKGLELRRYFHRGGTQVGVARARDLKNRRKLSDDTRMVSYLARHKVDKRGKNFGNNGDPSAGYIAWLFGSGDAGSAWAEEQKSA
ncbi:hypothetical protein ABID21_002683 [Pseudorhizobium tarimense]|uniref:Uncharacterized protein n=1 Tax=Pseudorhizobium tarimense TaxID=1079109 RepID=A0ABV2H7R5_9HYPH|nr:hypothetical protein [Pseudorhizobium tarimense]MCJ8519597.1 hypothetical protein [Pseudorhizobium tarimense]